MMREIKFRGICVITGDMFYGNLNIYNGCSFICALEDNSMREVSQESVGQYTSLKDKNGVEIYEGDILDNERVVFSVKWGKSGRWLGADVSGDEVGSLYSYGGQYKVIGNIYETIKEV